MQLHSCDDESNAPTELLMWPSAAWQVTSPPEGMWHV